jgi:hypothetical protein
MDLNDVASKCGALFLTGFWTKGKGMGRRILSGSMYRHCYLPGLTPRTYQWSLGPWNTYVFIFTNGRVWNPRGRPKQGWSLNKGCMTPCELCLLRIRNEGRCASSSFSQLLTVIIVGQLSQNNIAWWSHASMVYGDSCHYTHECEVTYNSTDGHGKLYTRREAGHHYYIDS